MELVYIFSKNYCHFQSTCIVVDAWIALICSVLVTIHILVVCIRVCLHIRRKLRGKNGLLMATRGILPFPSAVIQKDAHAARVMSHKNTKKHGQLFVLQTQRMLHTDLSTAPRPQRSPAENDGSVLVGPRAGDLDSEDSIAESDTSKGDSHPQTMLSKPKSSSLESFIPSLMTGRQGNKTKGNSGDKHDKQEKTHRQKFTPLRIAMTFSKPKREPKNKRNESFTTQSYSQRNELAGLSPDLRSRQELQANEALKKQRRISAGVDSLLQFDVDKGTAAVYEVKLAEVQLVKRLAVGPLSEVYAAKWRGTRVGVKLLLPRPGEVDQFEDAVKNFRREIWVMNSLKHPNILTLIGASLTPNCYVLVMEYMANGSLYDYLRDEANFIPPPMIVTTAHEIALAMSYIHARSVLQRDLKSKNCLISQNLVVKVSDFGLSRYRSKLYGEYSFVGTPFWAAPEVLRHEKYNEKADVYSFAIVLWELVERKDPYEDMNAMQVPFLVANDGLRPAEFTRPAPLGLEQLMKQCWDNDPEQRPDFAEIASTLAKWNKKEVNRTALSALIQREEQNISAEERRRFAITHDANAKAIPIILCPKNRTFNVIDDAEEEGRKPLNKFKRSSTVADLRGR